MKSGRVRIVTQARLYPNYLSAVESAYLAHTDDEAALSIENVHDGSGYIAEVTDVSTDVQNDTPGGMFAIEGAR
ncbi:MAG: hypothetical protein LBG57_00420 [Treponema sp.]|jgi:hypothetical protein|nr:hypothetical protein [Treponema sp.]